MAKRKIITIDEEKCTGCGQCIPNCPEGALQVIDGKARLVSDLFCDGLGACVGTCPEGAMMVEERDAEPYDEARVMKNIVKAGPNTIRAHLKHLEDHGATAYHQQAIEYLEHHHIPVPQGDVMLSEAKHLSDETLRHHAPQSDSGQLPCGCPGSQVRELEPSAPTPDPQSPVPSRSRPSRLKNWPIQLTLMPVNAPYLRGADLLIAADCAGASSPDFHDRFVNGKVLIIACPKLDDADAYREKLTAMFRANDVKSVTALHMTVPCCYGLVQLVRDSIRASGREIPFTETIIDTDGTER